MGIGPMGAFLSFCIYNRGLLTNGDTYQKPIPIHSNKQNNKTKKKN